jgi:hypothetical protein
MKWSTPAGGYAGHPAERGAGLAWERPGAAARG